MPAPEPTCGRVRSEKVIIWSSQGTFFSAQEGESDGDRRPSPRKRAAGANDRPGTSRLPDRSGRCGQRGPAPPTRPLCFGSLKHREYPIVCVRLTHCAWATTPLGPFLGAEKKKPCSRLPPRPHLGPLCTTSGGRSRPNSPLPTAGAATGTIPHKRKRKEPRPPGGRFFSFFSLCSYKTVILAIPFSGAKGRPRGGPGNRGPLDGGSSTQSVTGPASRFAT